MADFYDYFRSYSRVAPDWIDTCEAREAEGLEAQFGIPDALRESLFNDDGSLTYIPATQSNSRYLCDVVMDECKFRNISLPAVYLNTSPRFYVAGAAPALHAIFIGENFSRNLSKAELRAVVAHEIKHLYQKWPQTIAEKKLIEEDADCAAIEAAGYSAFVSSLQKTTAFMFSLRTGLKADFLHSVMPSFLSSHYPLNLKVNWGDMSLRYVEGYPTNLERSRKMKTYAVALEKMACDHS